MHITEISQNGHYYCIMRDDKTNIWLKFNDRFVSVFNINHLNDENDETFRENSKSEFEYLIDQNAYVLIYEKYNDINCEIFSNISSVRHALNNNGDILVEINSINNSYKDNSDENFDKYKSSSD